MGYDNSVLRAIVRLCRSRFPVTVSAIHLRVSGEESEVRAALRRLERMGLVARGEDRVALTLEGLAVGVASMPRLGAPTIRARRSASPRRSPARVSAA